MPIDRNAIYPAFNPENPTNVMDIPDNITENFGEYTFSFRRTDKEAWPTRNGQSKIYNGDYGIFINGAMRTDSEMANRLNYCNDSNLNNFIKQKIISITRLVVESEAVDEINSLEIPQNICQHNNLIKTFLYYSWHRCQIEDRAYPQSVGFSGRQKSMDFVNQNI